MPYHLATSPLKRAGSSAGRSISWSGQRGSNPRPPPWQGGALPTEPCPRARKYSTKTQAFAQALFCEFQQRVEPRPRSTLPKGQSRDREVRSRRGRAATERCARGRTLPRPLRLEPPHIREARHRPASTVATERLLALHQGQRDLAPLHVHRKHPDVHHVANRHDLARMPHEASR